MTETEIANDTTSDPAKLPFPIARRRPHQLVTNGKTRTDDWYWLNQKDNEEVISHLEAENSFTAKYMAPTTALQHELFEEMRGRILETDMSVAVPKGDWLYYSRTEESKQYAIHCRRPRTDNDDVSREQIILDENELAGNSDYFCLGAFDISPDDNFLIYSVDLNGGEIYTLHVRDLSSCVDLADHIENTYYGTAWSKDASVLFYTRPDDTVRPYQVWRHVVGQVADQDELIFQDDDERFFVSVSTTKTSDYVLVSSASSLTSETHCLKADEPLGSLRVIAHREQGIEYSVDHYRGEFSPVGSDCFLILNNEHAPNFKLAAVATSVAQETPGREHWQTIIEHRNEAKLDDIEVFHGFLVLSERENANAQLCVVDLSDNSRRIIPQDEPVYTAGLTGNVEFDSAVVRYEYTSLVTPRSIYDCKLASLDKTLLKQQPVLGDFNSDDYASQRVWATATDGTRIPISLVMRRDRATMPGPALLYGYGSYEISIDPTFSALRLSLLDRGFAFAIAHIRGGGDMGRMWYEHGKFFEKKNTFTDFIACAETLVANRITTAEQLVIRGGSAGGLLMGACTNMRPDLFRVVVAEVPFVDALTTMLDTSLPLTVHEFEEWGNPQDPQTFEYMQSYSPYDNVHACDYPAILATAGLNDPRVSYWEPAKWVQKLRSVNTSDHPILLKTEMGAGHQGPSGRYDAWKDEAFVFAFIFNQLGIE